MNEAQLLGSRTAKNGFANEREVADKFNSWRIDHEAQQWLEIMQYKLSEIEYVRAEVITNIFPKPKSDINVQITIKLKNVVDTQNISVKLVSNKKGFNQIDKRKVDKYVELWHIPEEVAILLKLFTGEIISNKLNLRDKRRMFMDEFSIEEQKKVLNFFRENQSIVVSDILRGRGDFAVEWVLVAQKVVNESKWILKNINEVMNYYSGDVVISKKCSINIGHIHIQRKGGTPDPTSLQFKIDPTELFNLS